MSTLLQSTLRNPFSSTVEHSPRPRSMAILPQNNETSPKSTEEDSVQTTSPGPPSMRPPAQGSPETDQPQSSNANGTKDPSPANNTGTGAAGASQAPNKVVQTAFIHKLYSMLEDRSISHLISWSSSNESFVMSPSNEFSKVLAHYFKHTNISSFVRQLNMYGFHKVSDVFHTGSSESALWEFKHGNGNFRKGDLMGLREIKRRASRHTLIHRDSFSNAKPNASQPGTPAEVMPDTDQRLAALEQAFYDAHTRLQRTEENYASMSARCQALTESLVRCHQWIHGVTGAIQNMSSPESALYADITNMQKEIARQLEFVRGLETPQDPRQPYYSSGGAALEPPVSPRGYNYPDSRRSSIQVEPQHVGLRPPVPAIPPHFSSSPRRFGSMSGPQASPGFSRPALPQQHPPQNAHPLSAVATPPPLSLTRRHTSADIREHGWPPTNTNGSPHASGQSSAHWQPSSPQQPPHSGGGDQAIRDQLAQYEINGPRRQTLSASQPTPPLSADAPPAGLGVDNVSWTLGGSKFPRPNFELHSAPATRRGSMATLHSLLNPAETAEEENEDDGPNEDRKRKRLQ
ncbi:Flocculation suppression protein [Exophiala dermatitidis]|uniref:Two-component system, unclassified family, response regulator n=2 Tax=Exophiala dermatitidis TaxID=5970 RepID=H6C921_EXODN|nr:two-component system, unclassified family, response regulator [Exophiala dermatitidis NIH/UT8656]KAJ4527623.1 Flocculation suppression protein [Exophiala dermatitidis]EHY60598.1 two-component system, unclassified family, response regulator [Exophiala dermatitidis NIH/UT8656]KAJ4528259.1 Flocculation suppression protein [Exophiala dermatitidis]KAJ4531199.1 Flocculation suppression protein [Exophiala dermatitidis]KAJ4558365.1 Flocculation suppression protein [Exophiala dermatitidis]